MKNLKNARILHDTCPKNYQNTHIFVFARKINKIPEFYMIFAWKNTGILGARAPLPSPMPMAVTTRTADAVLGKDLPIYGVSTNQAW